MYVRAVRAADRQRLSLTKCVEFHSQQVPKSGFQGASLLDFSVRGHTATSAALPCRLGSVWEAELVGQGRQG